VIVERDLTAIRGEGKYRGPIQIQSNALATLEAIDQTLADQVMAEGCVTGDRINGLCDGLTGDWYTKFDTFHPAVERGIPVTRVVSRVVLQRVLAECLGRLSDDPSVPATGEIRTGQTVVGYDNADDGTIWATLSDGGRVQGDVVVGADGIWSKVRGQMVGVADPVYSGYTCYTGISDFCPPDIDTVGYRVFLGCGRYFVSSDVGGGKMQWYAFLEEKAGGTDVEGTCKAVLMSAFGDWCDTVTDLVRATPEADVLRRDIYDRAPVFKWVDGAAVLLGDAAHAMQPNLGQGGCMAIEDAFVLAEELSTSLPGIGAADRGDASPADALGVHARRSLALYRYQGRRLVRAAVVHGMARMAALMASTYKTHLGDGLSRIGLGAVEEVLVPLRIPHPGRVAGYYAMAAAMPAVLDWVLGGFTDSIMRRRHAPACSLEEAPSSLPRAADGFERLMRDESRLAATARCDWVLVPGDRAARGQCLDFHGIEGHTLGATGEGEVPSHDAGVIEGGAGLTLWGSDAGGLVVEAEGGTAGPVAVVTRSACGLFQVTVDPASPGPLLVRSYSHGRVAVAPCNSHVFRTGDELSLSDDAAPEHMLVVKTRHVSLRPSGEASAAPIAAGGARTSVQAGLKQQAC